MPDFPVIDAADTSALLNASRCINSCVPPGLQGAAIIQLLNQSLNGTGNIMDSADVSALLDAARCVRSCVPPGMENPLIIYLLFQLAGGSGGGGGGIGCGNTFLIRDVPTSPEPPPPNIDCVYWLTFRDGSPTLRWDNVGHFWF